MNEVSVLFLSAIHQRYLFFTRLSLTIPVDVFQAFFFFFFIPFLLSSSDDYIEL